MNRYDIQIDGQTRFSYFASEPLSEQPEWVLSGAYAVVVTDLTGTPQDPPWIALRAKRHLLLTACDWTQLPDTPLDSAAKIAWESYRQALRDLPEQTQDPTNPAWPVAPEQSV